MYANEIAAGAISASVAEDVTFLFRDVESAV
jgi:hypothetical protein